MRTWATNLLSAFAMSFAGLSQLIEKINGPVTAVLAALIAVTAIGVNYSKWRGNRLDNKLKELELKEKDSKNEKND